MKKQLYLVFIAEVDIRSTNPHLTPGQESDPSASPTKLARATISRTVVVLKKTKVTKREAEQSQIGISSSSEKSLRKKLQRSWAYE